MNNYEGVVIQNPEGLEYWNSLSSKSFNLHVARKCLDLAEDILAILLANAAELEEKTEELQIQAKTAQDESSSPRLTAYPYRLIGGYKIRPTRASVNEAIHYHKQDFLLNEQGEFKERLRRADLEG